MSDYQHTTVLLQETIDALDVKPDGIYIDATFGGGGHSRLLLEKLNAQGKLFAFDQDETVRNHVIDDARFTFFHQNFSEIKRMLRFEGIKQVDGILADLGVSSHHFDTGERGFSYRFDAPLDMRMNVQETVTAADILNTYSAEKLQKIFSEYGEVRNSKTLAETIVKNRVIKPLRRISDLLTLTDQVGAGPKMRYLSQVFQALRIEVNDELGALNKFLAQSIEVLKPGGRIAVITFHSLEDRPVKNFFKTGNVEGKLDQDFYGNIKKSFENLTKKPILPSEIEIKNNPRARSAKLRVAEKL